MHGILLYLFSKKKGTPPQPAAGADFGVPVWGARFEAPVLRRARLKAPWNPRIPMGAHLRRRRGVQKPRILRLGANPRGAAKFANAYEIPMEFHRIPSISIRGTPRAIWMRFQDSSALGHRNQPALGGWAEMCIRMHISAHTSRYGQRCVFCCTSLPTPQAQAGSCDQVVAIPRKASESPWGYPFANSLESYGIPWNCMGSQ